MSGTYLQHYSRQGIAKVEVLVGVLVLALATWLMVPSRHSRNTLQIRAQCLANLGQIGSALQKYLNDNGSHWPYAAKLASTKLESSPWPTLPEVLRPYTNGNANLFHCPADRRVLSDDNPLRKRFSKNTTYFETEGTSYEWWFGEAYGGKKVGEESLTRAGGFGMGRADQPMLSDFEPFHQGDEAGTFNTLNADFKPRTTRARAKN